MHELDLSSDPLILLLGFLCALGRKLFDGGLSFAVLLSAVSGYHFFPESQTQGG